MKMQVITAYVKIGKSKEPILYIFHERDFIRIENYQLIIKNDERVLKIDEERICNIYLWRIETIR